MKLTVPIEDLVIGIICGLLLVGYTGRYFSFKLNEIVYVIALIVYCIFIVLDIFYEFSDLTTHFGFIVLSIINNLIDLVLSISLISFFGKWSIPYITSIIVPYLQNESYLFGIGVFFVAGNLLWLIVYPFTY